LWLSTQPTSSQDDCFGVFDPMSIVKSTIKGCDPLMWLHCHQVYCIVFVSLRASKTNQAN
jgi:hypothetical protein